MDSANRGKEGPANRFLLHFRRKPLPEFIMVVLTVLLLSLPIVFSAIVPKLFGLIVGSYDVGDIDWFSTLGLIVGTGWIIFGFFMIWMVFRRDTYMPTSSTKQPYLFSTGALKNYILGTVVRTYQLDYAGPRREIFRRAVAEVNAKIDTVILSWALPEKNYPYDALRALSQLCYSNLENKANSKISSTSSTKFYSDLGWWNLVRPLREISLHRADERRYPLISKIWYPNIVKSVREANWGVVELCDRFISLRPLNTKNIFFTKMKRKTIVFADRVIETPSKQCFPLWVSLMSGALVLVDSSKCRSGFFSNVLVVHHPINIHSPKVTTADVNKQLKRMAPGDYNGQLMNLNRVTVGNGVTDQNTSLILDTSHTTYVHSEHNSINCKRLTRLRDPVTFTHCDMINSLGTSNSVFTASKTQSNIYKDPRQSLRTNIVTAYVIVITSDKQIILAKRSNHVRHGKNVISAAAGGVVEIDPHGDIDEHGMPDVFRSVKRETLEELGLTLNEEQCKPVAVVQINSTNQQTLVGETEYLGQMVSCIFFLARVRHTASEVSEITRANGDIQKGKFEVEGDVLALNGCSLEEFRNQTGKLMSQMDQHGFISCLYASNYLFGTENTIASFSNRIDHASNRQAEQDDEAVARNLNTDLQSLLAKHNIDPDVTWWLTRPKRRKEQADYWDDQRCAVTNRHKGRACVHPELLIPSYFNSLLGVCWSIKFESFSKFAQHTVSPPWRGFQLNLHLA